MHSGPLATVTSQAKNKAGQDALNMFVQSPWPVPYILNTVDGRNPAPLHHFKTTRNHCLLVFTGESSFYGFSGDAKMDFVHPQYHSQRRARSVPQAAPFSPRRLRSPRAKAPRPGKGPRRSPRRRRRGRRWGRPGPARSSPPGAGAATGVFFPRITPFFTVF